ncbi:unnamed protein product, partial [Thlaspi arvense]
MVFLDKQQWEDSLCLELQASGTPADIPSHATPIITDVIEDSSVYYCLVDASWVSSSHRAGIGCLSLSSLIGFRIFTSPEIVGLCGVFSSEKVINVIRAKAPEGIAFNPAEEELEHVCGRPLRLRFDKKTGDLYIADAILIEDAITLEILSYHVIPEKAILAVVLNFDKTGGLIKYDRSSKKELKTCLLNFRVNLSESREVLEVLEDKEGKRLRFKSEVEEKD